MLEECRLCPHKCGVNRINNNLGMCKTNANIKIALVSLHHFEEPCISGNNGSGTVFFSNCNLKCIYCQNYEISQEGKGREVTIEELSDIFLSQQNKQAHNINLVSPTIYVEQIIESIKIAKRKGLSIPIIYNCGGYENVETIKMLKGYIDVYLPDFKYSDDDLAFKYSKVKNYTKVAQEAILEMYRQVGAPVLNDAGIITRGLIVRHLVLPRIYREFKKSIALDKEKNA